MNKTIFILSTFSCLIFSYSLVSGADNNYKKKILIFSSSGGGGHISSTNAVHSYLGDRYQIKAVETFKNVINTIDWLSFWTRGRFSGVDLYNILLTHKWYTTLNLFKKVGNWYFKKRSKSIKQQLEACIKKHNPDLVISVIPLINNYILEASKACGIPFLLIPTDLDIKDYLTGFTPPYPPTFHITLAFNEPFLTKQVDKVAIPQSQVSITGFPVRAQFMKNKNKKELKKEFSIPFKKPVLFIMMGAMGSTASYKLAQQIRTMKKPLHAIFVMGHNKNEKRRIEEIAFPEHISTTILGFTDRVADLMAISDIAILKSGSNSFCEAVYSNLPMILDITDGILSWEKHNKDFVVKKNIGLILTSYRKTKKKLNTYLHNRYNLKKLKQRLEALQKEHFGANIPFCVEKLLHSKVSHSKSINDISKIEKEKLPPKKYPGLQ